MRMEFLLIDSAKQVLLHAFNGNSYSRKLLLY